MKLSLPRGFLFFIVLPAFAPLALAASECDCSREIALCQVLGSYEDGKVTLNVYTEQCSRVTYSLNDIQATQVIVGGKAYIDWDGSSEPRVRIERCRICDYKSNTADDRRVRIE
jgi:hypothetical protein